MKGIVFLMLVEVIMVIGCAPYIAKNISVQGWTKDGGSVRQMQLDYQMCSGSVYVKEGISRGELEKDFTFCSQAAEDRERHKEKVATGIGMAGIIPFVGVGAAIASGAVRLSGSLSVERCMRSKGYVKDEMLTQQSERECMQAKGYRWE